MTITEFLEARIAEDEAAVRGALDGAADDGVWATAEDWEGGKERVKGKGILIYDEGGHTEGQAAHIARWDPARVLSECAPKRAIVAECRPGTLDDLDCSEDDSPAPMWVARALAAVYSGHPDYDKDWTL